MPMKRSITYIEKAGKVLREQGMRGLLSVTAVKAASILAGAANRLGGYAARHFRYPDREPGDAAEPSRPPGGPPEEPAEIWVDVGAHLGELTFEWARAHPESIVYAFEPNVKAASKIIGRLPNFVVIPIAVSARNGFATFIRERL